FEDFDLLSDLESLVDFDEDFASDLASDFFAAGVLFCAAGAAVCAASGSGAANAPASRTSAAREGMESVMGPHRSSNRPIFLCRPVGDQTRVNKKIGNVKPPAAFRRASKGLSRRAAAPAPPGPIHGEPR